MTDSEASTGIEMTTSRKERLEKEREEYEIKMADPVQSSMGALGKWHLWVCAIVFILKFPVAWHQMGIIFLGPPAKYKCISPSNFTNACSADCKRVEYDRSIFTETITTQWGLICDKLQLLNFAQTSFMLGILCGSFFFGMWADKSGRRKPLVVAVFIQLISGIATSFSNSLWLFCLLRFITAIATGGTMCTSFVIVMEIIGTKWRELFSVLYQIPFNLGHLTLPVFAYFIRDWHKLQFAISIPSVLLLSYYWLLPESPRWLYASGHLDEAAAVLEKAAKQNGLPTETIRSDLEEATKRKRVDNEPANTSANVIDLFRTPNLRMKSTFMCFNWFVCGLAFFGVAQYMGQIGGDIFANVAIGAALELPGTIVCILMMKYWGRKKTLIASNTLTGISMLLIAFVPPNVSWAVVTLSSLGIVGMSISFPTVYLYGGELFPTVVRNVGIGLASMIARIGSMIAPFVAGLSITVYWLPPIIFGIIPLLGAILVFWLPETKGHNLPETIQDGENFGKKVIDSDDVRNGK